MTQNSTYQVGQTVIYRRDNSRVVYLGGSFDGEYAFIGQAGETEVVTVPMETIVSTDEHALELAVEYHGKVIRVRRNISAWKRTSAIALSYQETYATLTGMPINEVSDLVAERYRREIEG